MRFSLKPSARRPCSALLTLSILAATPVAATEVDVKFDGLDPQKVDLGNQVTIVPGAVRAAASTTLNQFVKPANPPVRFLDGDRYLKAEITPAAGKRLTASAYKVVGDTITKSCSTIGQRADGSLVIERAYLGCEKRFSVRGAALVEVLVDGQEALYIYFPNRQLILADDQGISLTLVDRWHDSGGSEGARSNAGASYYVSMSNLRNEFWRLIGNFSVLDADPDIDFEVGAGIGVMVKLMPLSGGNSLGLAGGVGYNLMMSNSDDALYSFFGFSINLNGGGDE